MTGRRVIALLGDNQIDPGIAVGSIVLEPSTDGGAEDRSGREEG